MPDAPAPAETLVVHPGDVIQITDQADKWFRAILVVDEVKGWGVQAFAIIPHNDRPAEDAYYRVQHGKFAVISGPGGVEVATRPLFDARAASLETAAQLAAERGK